MNSEALRCKVRITNREGLHMRPMNAFVQLASRFESAVRVSRTEDQWVDGKSSWGLLGLAAEQGTELTLEVSGPDAPEAFKALVEFLTHLEEFEAALQAPGADNP